MDDQSSDLNQRLSPFERLVGLRLISVTPEEVKAELLVREELCTQPAVMHGGALMALADALGAHGTTLNLPSGASTTTLESKTNFFAPAQVGSKVTAHCYPLHRGRRTMVWQTRITSEKGRLLAMVTQTQLVLSD